MQYNLSEVEKIKKLSIIGLSSDDMLMETLVLKGGNAMSIAYNVSTRASYDLDYSMSDDFIEEIESIKSRIESALTRIFKENNYHIFDFKIKDKPRTIREDVRDFWGGYEVEFKLLEINKLENFSDNIDAQRRNATVISPNNSSKFSIDISKYEYIGHKQRKEIDGYTFFVYSIDMIIGEKLRAICQQLPQYSEIIKTGTQRGRARDFYDIYTLMQHYPIDIKTPYFKEILKHIFDAKKVPFMYVKEIKNYKEIHQQDFIQLENTVSAPEKAEMKDFDFYFQYIIENFENILD